MYKIYADNTLIYDSTLEDYKIGKGSVTLETNKSGSFTFSIYPDHFFYDNFVRLKTVITVYKSGRIVFRGRILNDVTDYWNNKVITCEGELGFLQDSIIRPFAFSGTPEALFKKFVEEHNSQVDEFKRFKIGTVTVVDPNNYIARENSGYESALSNLNSRLIEDSLGGYFYLTHGEDGTDPIPTINYLADFTNVATQVIEFGSNLKNYTKTVKAEDIATAIIPIGATISREEIVYDEDGDPVVDENDEIVKETVEEKVTIAKVNDDKDYVYSAEAVALYGWIFKSVTWDDVTNAYNLKVKAEAYLESIVNQNITIELTAIDLHLLDQSIESFSVGDYVRVISAPHNFDSTLLCNKQTIDLLKPENDSLVLGRTYSTFTESSNKISTSVIKVASLKSTVSSVSSQIVTLSQTTTSISNRVKTLEESGGTEGESGATFTPSVDTNGNLSWSNDKGLDNPSTVNIKGPQGEKGDTGAKGDTGEQGIQGETGPQGEIGPQGEKGDPFTYSDFTAEQLEALRGPQGETGPQGEKGDTGANGQDGTSATINGVNTLTIEAGENIELEQTDNVLKISATGGGNGGDYEVWTVDEIRLICGWQANGLPVGYTLLDFIESTGSQYIDTGFIPNQDTRVICRASVPIGSTNWLYGARTSASSNAFTFAGSSSGYYVVGYNTKTKSFDTSLNSDGVILIDANKAVTTLTTENGSATITGTSGTFTAPGNLILFGVNANGSVTKGKVKIYSCQIYDNDVLIRDFVPCINPNGIYGLYDKSNKRFYYNAGTGTFTGG